MKDKQQLYPLRFEPIYQYRLWGGRRLAEVVSASLPGNGPIGEAWLLSDRADHPSVVADGPLKGQTLGQLLERSPEQILGKFAGRYDRFPLLLKFLDAREMLSVQVHPSDLQTAYLPVGEQGKTEAWIVLDVGQEGRIYAGLKPDTTSQDMTESIANGTVADCLSSFIPEVGDGILLPAGTVHTFGDLVVFEVQQNSDVTFRLYDWDHIDANTGRPRDLQVEQAMACIDYSEVALRPAQPILEENEPHKRERLFDCEYFRLWRMTSKLPISVGEQGEPRILVCVAGEGNVEHEGIKYPIACGDVLLLPAIVGACKCRPLSEMILLEISLPEGQ